MEESILVSIKKLLGIDAECIDFDTDIILHINTVFMILYQMGVGPTSCYHIEKDGNTWSEFIEDSENLESVKSYIYLKVKKVFDPASSSYVNEAYEQTIKELEYRLYIQAEENKKTEV